jgi:hypothetical protein
MVTDPLNIVTLILQTGRKIKPLPLIPSKWEGKLTFEFQNKLIIMKLYKVPSLGEDLGEAATSFQEHLYPIIASLFEWFVQ